ncbi:regulatory protein RecX [Thiohalomonas denitrificans]|uniref:Regulatory protein RecX n=1 Tax=Thiohalomonas denitrificans TaxID=415747 RepID=A0A1G5PKH0_9GAMM|nr:regulatory protein RecX [Thiohalomonas denitrificans]SCZ49671.1 regulatory protein [Thiohalomonas denitrificans]
MGMASDAEVRETAIRLLARREHSRRELAFKLDGRGFDREQVDPILDDLESRGLLSDVRFAEFFVRSRVSNGCGPLRIRAELRERGVEDGVIAGQLAEVDADWCELAAQVRRKRFGEPIPGEFKQRAKQMRFLQYRGFESEQIRAAVRGDEWD